MYRRQWKAPFGAPRRLLSDGGAEFEGPFQEGLHLDGTADERSAARAPWQNGLVERHQQTWKQMFHRVIGEVEPQSRDEIEEVCEQINVAKNSLVNRDGHSPMQRVYGVQVRVPGLLYSGEAHEGINSGIVQGDDAFVKANRIRQEARRAFIEADDEDRLRRALEHRTRPDRGPHPPGAKVLVWRPRGSIRGLNVHCWRGPGTVIGNTDGSRYWVAFGSKILRCAPEQLRRLNPEDEAAVKLMPPELEAYTRQISKRGVATYHDISGQAKPPREPTAGEDYWEWHDSRVRRVHVVPRRTLYVPSADREDDQPPIAIDHLQDTRVTTIQHPDRVASKWTDNWRVVGAADCAQVEHAWLGHTDFWVQEDTRAEEQPAKRSRVVQFEHSAEEYQTPEVSADVDVGTDTELPGLSEDGDAMRGVTGETEAVSVDLPQGQADSEEQQTPVEYGPIRTTPLTQAMRRDLNALDHGRPPSVNPIGREALVTEVQAGEWLDKGLRWKIDWEKRVVIRHHRWRKLRFWPTKTECPVPVSWLTGVRYTLKRDEARPDVFITDTEEAATGLQQSEGHWWSGYTVLEFEPPITVDSPDAEIFEVNEVTLNETTKYERDLWDGKLAEINKLLKYEAVSIVAPSAAKDIRRDRQSSQRILPSRFVITKKPSDTTPGEFKVKARWCIRGYLDPDLLQVEKQSPTLTSEAFSLVLQVSASRGWHFTIADVEGAFLQGDKLVRPEGQLYVEPPPGGAPGIPDGALLKVEKAVYGLCDAPRQWHGKVQRTMLELGLKMSALDPCLYYHHKNGQLHGLLTIHVDDLITTGDAVFEEEILSRLKQKFPFKHWKQDEGEFLGRYVKRQPDGSIIVSQEEYCQKLKTIEVSRERRRERDRPLTDRERSQLRGVAGGLNWLATATRPDLAAMTASVQQSIAHGCVADLAEANKAVAEARDFSKTSIHIRPIDLQQLQLLVTADASWTTEGDLRSQGAYMICATTGEMQQGAQTMVSPLRWKSQKQERAVGSTLAAELLTVSKGVSEARWMRHFFLEALFPEYSLDTAEEFGPKIPIVAVTDNKPLYDHIRTDQGICQDKRLAIEVLLLRRDVKRHGVELRWVDTAQMLVDCMTKKSVKPTLMRHVLREGLYSIREESEWLELKKKARTRRTVRTQ